MVDLMSLSPSSDVERFKLGYFRGSRYLTFLSGYAEHPDFQEIRRLLPKYNKDHAKISSELAWERIDDNSKIGVIFFREKILDEALDSFRVDKEKSRQEIDFHVFGEGRGLPFFQRLISVCLALVEPEKVFQLLPSERLQLSKPYFEALACFIASAFIDPSMTQTDFKPCCSPSLACAEAYSIYVCGSC